MAKHSYSPDVDQFDPKVHRETLGSFGTTTKPGGNQLQELQAKIRQGVKHVELHLNGAGKGEWGQQDVPDKYGFEQRRTIMQLAKLNEQTLSVHAALGNVSFSGLGQGGFNEGQRAAAISEMDETIEFAAQTAKKGAIVFHLQGEGVSSSRSDVHLSEKYVNWLKKNNPEEYKRIKEEHLGRYPFKKLFTDNPSQIEEIKNDFNEKLTSEQRKEYEEKAKKHGHQGWEEYLLEQNIEKLKLQPDLNPYIVIGDRIEKVERHHKFLDLKKLSDKGLSDKDKEKLKKLDIDLTSGGNINDVQKLSAIFTNDTIPTLYKDKLSESDFNNLKSKLIVDYKDILEKNDFLQPASDKEFYKKFNEYNIDVMNLQKRSLETKYRMYRDEFERVKALETENEQALKKSQNLGDSELELAQKDAIKQMIAERNREIQHLIVNAIGQNEYHELTRFDETVAKINQQITDLDSKTRNVSSLSDKVFEKNTAALGHFGVRALKHQLDLKQKSKVAENEVKERTKKVLDLEKRYQESTDVNERNKINSEIIKEKAKLRNWVGVKDYSDIDVKESPLYVAPENMLPGMGSLTPLEEYKGMIRIGWENFAQKILSNDSEYKKLREQYEKETGIKITEKNALEVAKKHIAGTFDNAHLGAWLKHFRKIEGEDEEHRIQEFNKWINSQAEDMAKEGIIRHIHLNDTKGKDDDHNLLGQGILDIHDLRERLRKAGIDEPFIVEAGGRGAASNMHILNAFEVFNPALTKDGVSENGIDYKVRSQENGSGVSDWVSVQRDYVRRPQYSTYGMSYNTFRAAPPQDGAKKGDWSGLGFF